MHNAKIRLKYLDPIYLKVESLKADLLHMVLHEDDLEKVQALNYMIKDVEKIRILIDELNKDLKS